MTGEPDPGHLGEGGAVGHQGALRQRSRSGAWQAARRILCVRLDGLGDLVMTGPAIRALAESGARRRITLLTSKAGARAASLLPGIDEVIAYEAPWMKATPAGRGSEPDGRMISRLRAATFDAAVIFTVYSQSPLPAALLLHLADVPLRLAFCRENPYHLLSDWAEETEPQETIRHEVRRHLDLVAQVGARPTDERLRVEPRRQAREKVVDLLGRHGLVGARDWYAVHPGASAASRRYPPESFARAISSLWRRQRLIPVLTGSGEEAALTAAIVDAAGVPAVNLAGRLDLHELTALLEQAPLLLSNNTGPAHLAAGVGTPVVDLYALTNPQHTPWQVPARVLYRDVPCRFCYRSVCPQGHHACLRGVPPDEVAEAVAELLARTEDRSAAAPAGECGDRTALAGVP
ncbi:MAG TPA: glycosyltransferase family 9 protein [Trueperaceae bacterium]